MPSPKQKQEYINVISKINDVAERWHREGRFSQLPVDLFPISNQDSVFCEIIFRAIREEIHLVTLLRDENFALREIYFEGADELRPFDEVVLRIDPSSTDASLVVEITDDFFRGSTGKTLIDKYSQFFE